LLPADSPIPHGICRLIEKNAPSNNRPVGAGCLGDFDHDFIQTLPNGYSAVIADIEKIYPPGTQGNTSGLPMDIIGNMIVVLNSNWQAVWYFDAFEHAGGAAATGYQSRGSPGRNLRGIPNRMPPGVPAGFRHRAFGQRLATWQQHLLLAGAARWQRQRRHSLVVAEPGLGDAN
jgi:hypothetical protein